jgi:hypothetical protein
MSESSRKMRFSITLFLVFGIAIGLFSISDGYGQNLRNPVLEFCTGTWCQWCPCGDSTVINSILPNIPNAIILAYHGPANSGSEPFSFNYGNTIISLLGLSGYPTGVVDRVSGIVNWNTTWVPSMNSRVGVPAGVEIEMVDRSYNPTTRLYDVTVDITALQNLSGQFNYNLILVEDEIVYGQTSNNTCTPGLTYIANFVHEWLVRDMMNGATGTQVVNGTWNQGETFTKNFQYTVPVPQAPAPDIVPDHCRLVVLVYKVGSPLNSNAEIQQAEQWPMIPLDYAASMVSEERDIIGGTSAPSEFSATLKNEGLLSDTYYIELSFDGPGGWSQSYTTVNGTHQAGEIDSVDVASGDSTNITVSIDPSSLVGYGKATLEFSSKNSPSAIGSLEFRLATYGMDILVVDDDQTETYENFFIAALNNLGESYGVVSSSAVPPAGSNLSTIGSLLWLTGLSEPGLNEDEMNALRDYLDAGGTLYLNGVDMAYQMADPSSPYYTTSSLDFFNNYLHANYVTRTIFTLAVNGVSGDPISNGISQMLLVSGTGVSNLGSSSGKYPNQVGPFDANATPIFTFLGAATKDAGIRANHSTGKVIFTTFGLETVAQDSLRTKIVDRTLEWFGATVGIGNEPPQLIKTLELSQNYPNPFNPETEIKFALPSNESGSQAALIIYNQLGQKIRTLFDENRQSGRYEVTWDGTNDAGITVSSGVYYYHLKYGKHSAVKKMIYLR